MKVTRLLLVFTLIVTSVLIASCGGEATTTTEPEPTTTETGQFSGPAKAGDTVAVHYIGTLDDGTKFDASRDRGQPLSFTVGAGQMILGFDNAVVGMKVGETKTVTLPPEEAYGPYLEELVVTLSRSQLEEGLEPFIGQQLIMSQPDGQVGYVTVVAITETDITIDANHELAGEALTFEIEMVSIEPGE